MGETICSQVKRVIAAGYELEVNPIDGCAEQYLVTFQKGKAVSKSCSKHRITETVSILCKQILIDEGKEE